MLDNSINENSDDFRQTREISRVAWLYFIGGMTQGQIAEELRMTRLRVNKIIGHVRSAGLVNIEIRTPLADCVELEERLKEHFGLRQAVVVPTLVDPIDQQRLIGEAAGELLNTVIGDEDIGLGIGWGRTLSSATRRLEIRPNENSWVVGLMGGVTRAALTNTFEVAMSFATTLGVECHYLTAPLYCSNADTRRVVCENDEIARVLSRTKYANAAMVSCGTMREKSPIPLLHAIEGKLDELERLGAVGEVLGFFLAADGSLVDHPINECVVAMSPSDLKGKPVAILASGGLYKAQIIKAVLRGGYVNHLVTDEAVARLLLKSKRGP